MRAKIEIEWGSDALDGAALEAAQGQVIDTVHRSIRHGLTEGAFQVSVSGSVFPVDVRFRRLLMGPELVEPATAESPAGGR